MGCKPPFARRPAFLKAKKLKKLSNLMDNSTGAQKRGDG